MSKARIAIVGLGNIGRCALEALENAPDMLCAGIVRRNPEKTDLPYKAVNDIRELGKVDAAILCTPSRAVGENALKYLQMGISTVDSFDIHKDICGLRKRLDSVARSNSAVSIVSAGWDPGTDSVVRAIMLAMVPQGITFTDFGPGRSMGHSVAAKAVPGVREALSLTIPAGKGIHKRKVYVELEDGADFEEVSNAVKTDPYFASDETSVEAVTDVAALNDNGHGVKISRNGISGITDSQMMEFAMRINNPALTGQILVSSARAALRQQPGCYTMIEIPPVDFLPGDRDSIISQIV